jgi:hypothetical protein
LLAWRKHTGVRDPQQSLETTGDEQVRGQGGLRNLATDGSMANYKELKEEGDWLGN